MGYLDGDSVTVDAILTKHGRFLLSLGQGLNITYFALADDGVDYNLWNTSHASGSDYYDDAITSMPNLEAVPDDGVIMKYKLWGADRNLIYWPIVDQVEDFYLVSDSQIETTVIPDTNNFSNETYTFKIYNVVNLNLVSPSLGSGTVTGPTDSAYVPNAGIPYDVEFNGQTRLAFQCAITDVPVATNIDVIGDESGALKNFTVYCDKNRPRLNAANTGRT